MAGVNIVVTGVPVEQPTRCLQLYGNDIRTCSVADAVSRLTTIPPESFFLLSHGRIAKEQDIIARAQDACAFLEFRFRRILPGGKGGFGAMLRGANASKKTTNFGACRDLSGRRLRDIEEEREVMNSREFASRVQPEEQGTSRDAFAVDSSHAPEREILEASNASEKDDKECGFSAGTALDAESLKDNLDALSENVVDAVADGLRAARVLRKQCRKSKRKKLNSPSQDPECIVASVANVDQLVPEERNLIHCGLEANSGASVEDQSETCSNSVQESLVSDLPAGSSGSVKRKWPV